MNFTIAVLITALAVFAVPFRVALAYNIETHAYLADETLSFYKNHFKDTQISEELRSYFIDGARREDDGARSLNHFYDPVYNRGLTEPVLGTWEKSKDWANNSINQNNLKYKVPAVIASILSAIQQKKISAVSDVTNFTWQEAIRYWANNEKEKAIFTLGHIIHLIEDASVPDHTRNDLHAAGSPYESWADKFSLTSIDSGLSSRLERRKPIVLENLSVYFDELAVYSNNNFYSKDTIGIQSGYKSPEPDYFSNCGDYICGIKDDDLGSYKILIKKKGLLNNIYASNGEISIFFEKSGGDVVINAYWSRLSTKAVQYGAGVINLFFKEAEAAKNNPNFNKKEQTSFIANVIDVVSGAMSAVGGVINRATGFLAEQLGINNNPVAVVTKPAEPVQFQEQKINNEQSVLFIKENQTELSAVGGLSPEVEASLAEDNEAARLIAIRHQLENIADLIDDLKLQMEARAAANANTAGNNTAGNLTSNQMISQTDTLTSVNIPLSGGSGSGGGSAVVPKIFPKLLITEIQLSSASSTYDEFVELYNPNESTVVLTDWYVQKKTASGTSFSTFAPATLFTGKSIPARGYFLVTHPSSTFAADVFTSYGISNNNTVVIKNPDGGIMDKVGWGSANDCEGTCAPNPADSQSIQRKFTNGVFEDTDRNADNFELQTCPSPKARTASCTTAPVTMPTSTVPIATSTESIASSTEPVATSTVSGANHLVISEVQVAGVDAGDEFIELYNPTVADVDLSNWSLQYVSTSTDTFSSTTVARKQFSSTSTISAKGFYLIARRLDGSGVDGYRGSVPPDMTHRSISLSRNGGRIFLVASSEYIESGTNPTIVDMFDYRSLVPTSGESLERRAWHNGACVSPLPSATGEFLGNECDTDSTDDFSAEGGPASSWEIRAVPNPQNVASFPEPRATPAVPAAADSSSSIVNYGSSSLAMSFAWAPSADYAGATSSVRYELYDESDAALSTLVISTTSLAYSYRVNEVGREYRYALRAIDRDGLRSATTTITIVVPSFLNNLYFYRDPRTPDASYRVDIYYDKYPFIPARYSSGGSWRLPVFYLNRAPLKEQDIHLGEPSTIPQILTDGALSFSYYDCGRNPRVSDFLVLPDTAGQCAPFGPDSGDFSYNDLEDFHLSLILAPFANEVIFTPSDYFTVAFYDFSSFYWATRHRMFSLVATDRTKYYFRDIPPEHYAPIMNASTTVDFDEINARLIVSWEAATDADTLDNLLSYEINFTQIADGATASSTAFDDARWESAGRQPSAQIDDQTFVSYRFVRTVSPGDAFVIGVRVKDEFGNVSNVAATSWAYPATVIVLSQESANGWSVAWGEKTTGPCSACPPPASIQSIVPTGDIRFNKIIVRIRESEYHGYGPATLRLSVYGDSGGRPDLNTLIGTALLGGVEKLIGDSDSTFSFSPTISFTAGTRYWLMLDVAGYFSNQGFYYNKWQNAVNVGSDAYAGGEAGIGAGGECPDQTYCRTTVPLPAGTPDWYFKLGLRE